MGQAARECARDRSNWADRGNPLTNNIEGFRLSESRDRGATYADNAGRRRNTDFERRSDSRQTSEEGRKRTPKQGRAFPLTPPHAPSASLPSIALSFSAQHTAALWCPLYVRMASPDERSHSLAVASEEAETR